MTAGMRPHGGPARKAFTLIELLVVVGIIGLMAGLIAFLPRSERRLAAVRSAAEELAATLRSARAIAMDQRIVCGVAFNIRNAPGTSGRQLNNHDGGHWYRIIGATVGVNSAAISEVATYPIPSFEDSVNGHGNVGKFLRATQNSWIGDKHVLAPRKVRFLALTDQDNGTGGWMGASVFPATYPRPWFGWWDAATKRLHPWGGYDTGITDPAGRKCSAFYFEGDDGPITGCRNPTDRMTTHVGANGDPYRAIAPVGIFEAGQARPTVNADWLDYVLFFHPDGTAGEQSPMSNRRLSWYKRGSPTAEYSAGGTGSGDLGSYTALPGGLSGEYSPMTSYVAHTGRWAITLAPDMDQDRDTFSSAQAAIDAIMPACRVVVTRLGEVKVVRVTQAMPAGTVIDTTSISDWQNPTQVSAYYQNFIATNPTGMLRGAPISDFLVPQMMSGRQWWLP